MPGLRQEIGLFLHAILVGVILLATYLCVQILRKMIPHRSWIIQLEDLAYWIGMAIYLFLQLYHSNNGKIRWYSLMGLVLGGVILWKVFSFFRRSVEKICYKIMKKYKNRID